MPFDNAQGTLPRWLAFLLALSERNESKCAPAATRTRNHFLKRELLYQLSYEGKPHFAFAKVEFLIFNFQTFWKLYH